MLIGYKDVSIRDVARDRFGNLYATGSFSSSSIQIGNVSIPRYGQMSMFLLKFNKDMSLAWGKSVGSVESEFPMVIEIDKEDNIVVGGYFLSPTISFDCIDLQNAGRSEMFLAKYASDGRVLWATGTTGLQEGFKMDLAITISNDIIVSSTFMSGNISFGGQAIEGFGGYDSFVASVSSRGSLNWLRSFGCPNNAGYDYIFGLDVDSQENIAVTGFFGTPSISFDEFNIEGHAQTENYFVAKLDKSGKTMWANGGTSSDDQAGVDVVVDTYDNIIVAGRFYGMEIEAGNFVLINQSDAHTSDAFVATYDPNGNILNARSFGGSGFDSPGKMALDKSGNVLIGGYFYSYTFTVDNFTAQKSAFKADAFLVTLDDQLKASCFKRVSGTAENYINEINTDDANNIWIIVENGLSEGITEFDDAFTADSKDFTSMLVSIGDNSSFAQRPANQFSFDVDLGHDIIKCESEVKALDPGLVCDATYSWSDGSSDRFLSTANEGTYWVDVTLNGKTIRDSITIQNLFNVQATLGPDSTICEGATLELSPIKFSEITPESTCLWNDGSTLSFKKVNEPGLYWVTITSQCNTVIDTISVSWTPPLTVDLGEDKMVCTLGETELLTGPTDDHLIYEWQDGSTQPELAVSSTGVYTLSVSNECETTTDSINVTFFDPEKMIIPNIVTANYDQKNETLILPDFLIGSRVTISDRWGLEVFRSVNYQNTWAGDEGTYFLTINGPCMNGYKGVVQVVR